MEKMSANKQHKVFYSIELLAMLYDLTSKTQVLSLSSRENVRKLYRQFKDK